MAKTHLLLCQHQQCDYSIRVPCGDLPTKCPKCKRQGRWRIGLSGEWTADDARFLRSMKIGVD